jgi:hypothetical protein
MLILVRLIIILYLDKDSLTHLDPSLSFLCDSEYDR